MNLPNLNIDELSSLDVPDLTLINQKLAESLVCFHHKIVVLDDDPTGTQTVHGVSVYTDWKKETLYKAFTDEQTMFFILTNSRSLSAQNTAALHKEIAERISTVSKQTDTPFLLLSRGDSTLRGHYPLETDILQNTLEKEQHCCFDGEILCPFFEEGGRFTFNNIHYVQDGNTLIPAGQTEFAKDKTFSYTSSDLTEYIEEKTQGAYPKETCLVFSLDELRHPDYAQLTKKLLAVQNHTKIVVNAVSYSDLKVFSACLLDALKQGKTFITRCAGSLPKVLGNISDIPLLKKEDLIPKNSNYGGLIIIGSHVKKTTAQFHALKSSRKQLAFLEFNVNACFSKGGLSTEADSVLNKAERLIKEGQTVVVYTSRELLAPEHIDPEELLALSVSISDSLTSIVSKLSIQPKFILAKGGITSSDVATKGLAVEKAEVMGQIQKGIPVWMTGDESKFPNTPYIIFPGNVGTENTLREIVEELN